MQDLSFASWCRQRQEERAGADSWLGMAGLFWLEAGVHGVGGLHTDAVFIAGAPHVGRLEVSAGQKVRWLPAMGDAIDLVSDKVGKPSTVDFENHSFFIVEREGRLAMRLRNPRWRETIAFTGLRYFDEDPAWIVEADWLALPEPLAMEVPNVLGELKPVVVTQQAVFFIGKQRVCLLPMSVSEREVFFVFRDRTCGQESYGAGRFLKADAAVDGKIRLDFNRAYNPPCAFTAFATCPLPPPENWLPFAVQAGEKKPEYRRID